MNKILLSAFALALAIPAWQAAQAQAPANMNIADAAHRHADGLILEHRGDDWGAFIAYLEAAEGGYAPAQRRVAEIYDSGNAAVVRNFPESIRWYERAREGGEQIPPPKSPMPTIITRP
jgi:TPR repeat protein